MHPMINATTDLARRAAAQVEQERVTPDEAARHVCGEHFWFLATRVARQFCASTNGRAGRPQPAPLNRTADPACTP